MAKKKSIKKMWCLVDDNGCLWSVDETKKIVMEDKMQLCHNKIGRSLFWKSKVLPCKVIYEI